MTFWKKIQFVYRRELRFWSRNRTCVFGAFVPLIASAVFYSMFFSEGLPSNLPIAVVDQDNSSISRRFVRELDATQLGSVLKFDDYSEARREMQKGNVNGICVIPKGLAADVQANRQPCFSFYINGLYFVGGSMAYKDLLTMLNMTAGGVQREYLRARGMSDNQIMGLIRPIDIETHQIGNASADYGIYLLGGFLPGVLAMSVVLSLVYSLGTELKYSYSRRLMSKLNDDISAVVLGKCMIYVPLFTLMGWAIIAMLYVFMGFPFAGNLWWMLLDIVLLVLASAGAAIVIITCIPVCRFALSVSAIYCTLALTLSGFSLPCETFPTAIRALCIAFPLRHYYLFFVSEGIFANGFAGIYPEIIHLLLFLVAPILLLPRLRQAFIDMDYPKD